jgi:sulfide:quinone oxidoreductase
VGVKQYCREQTLNAASACLVPGSARGASSRHAGPARRLSSETETEASSKMANQRVLVLGGNFAGLMAALSVKHDLGEDVDVTVVSKSDRFQFNPSLIWIPFGKRTVSSVTFPVAQTFESHQVDFVHGEATRIDADSQRVETSRGAYDYDYLVIATGYLNDFDIVPGLGPGGNAFSITDLEGAVNAAEGWAHFLNDPGPVVVAATQGAACFGAAYEFVFNVAYHLKKHKLKVPLSYVSAEVLKHSGLGNPKGFIEVKDTYQTHTHANVYAAGIATAVNAPWQSANAVGVPKTGFPAETMARVAADNIAAQIRGQQPSREENFASIPAVCIMDAGNNGVIILADHMLPPRKHGVMIPGPQSHAAKLAFEKYFLWKTRKGYVKLP